MRTQRILLVSHEMTYTGAPNSLLNIARLLKAKGHHVAVSTLEAGDFSQEFIQHGFPVELITAAQTEEYLQSLPSRYDIVVANTVFCAAFAAKAQESVKTILYLREAQNLPDIIRDCNLNKEHIRAAKNVVCVSKYAASFIKRNYSPKRLHVLHNFLFPEDYGAQGIRAGDYDVRLHILIAGTIERRKGVALAVEAVRTLPMPMREEVVLHLAGRRPEWSRDYWAPIDLARDASVVYHGEVQSRNEMNALYANSDVVMVPSLDESCSLVALEGALFGKYLILTENVGAKYLVKGKSGMVIPAGSVDAIRSAVLRAAAMRAELKDYAKHTLRRFNQTSLPEQYDEGFIRIVNKLR